MPTSSNAQTDLSPLKILALLPEAEREEWLAECAANAKLSVESLIVRLNDDWSFLGRPKQQPPPGGWTYWFVIAGRGFGKTLTGAHWVKKMVEENPGCRIALIAPTSADVRETMVEGETGLLSILPDSMLRGGSRSTAWNRSTIDLYMENGARVRGFSSEKPDRLRGPQHHFVWGEEVSSWNDAAKGDALETTFSNMKLGLRLGDFPRACLTSTPKANKLTREILKTEPGTLVISRGSSYENRDNLSEVWWRTVVAPYEGTRLGRQEIHAEILDDVEGALWTLRLIDSLRVRVAPPLHRVVVAVDPNASSDEAANSAGIVVCGHDGRGSLDRSGYVLADRTVLRASPRAWAQAAVDAYYEFEADRIVAEKNQGGEMVSHTINTVDPTIQVKLVSATKGKRVRAEPVASLYEGSETVPGRVHHVGAFPELEDEMTTWTPGADSPDRMDALVWGMTELMLGAAGTMRSSVPKGRIPTAGERQILADLAQGGERQGGRIG